MFLEVAVILRVIFAKHVGFVPDPTRTGLRF